MCAADTIVRMRARSRATVGKTTDVAKTPSSNRRPENRIVAPESPRMTGVIGVSETPVSNPRSASPALNSARVGPERVEQLGLLLEDPDGLDAGGGDRRRMRGREQERTSSLDEDLAEGTGARHVTSEHADGLRQRPDLDRDATVEIEMVDAASTRATEDAGRVGVVDHHCGTELLGRLDDAGQRRDVAVHREDAVGHDEDQSIRPGRPGLAQDVAQRLDVLVREDLAGSLGEAHPVDDRGVVELVGHDEVALAGDRRDHARVRREARLERQDRLGSLELGELGLELLVQRHRSGDRPDRAGAGSVVLDRLQRSRPEPGMIGEAEIVVRRQ